MKTTNDSFDTLNELDYKTPIYTIEFDGEAIRYCNHLPVRSGDLGPLLCEDGDPLLTEDGDYIYIEDETGLNQYEKYLVTISGLAHKVTPEEGQATIGSVKFGILDVSDSITLLIASDPYQFHRKKVTVKAGYQGMTEDDLLTIAVCWVTELELSKDGGTYEFTATDPQRWMQRKVFRGAEDTPVEIQGNVINVLLAVLTSTGNGTNGDYDWYDAENGLGLSTDYINVASIEKVRDRWFPGDSAYVKFSIYKREIAKSWFETEIFQPFNLYPTVDGDGRFNIKPIKPPLVAIETTQSFDDDSVQGLPSFSCGFSRWLINEVEFFYDWDPGSEAYETNQFFLDSDSINNRGPGRKVLTIKSKGLKTSNSPGSISGRADDIIERRKNQVFQRFANPPVEISFDAFFSRWISEPGDVVPFTHKKLPDLERGVRGLDESRMEIINRDVNWRDGKVKIQLLNTGFAKNNYFVISPSWSVVTGSAAHPTCQFTVASTTEAAKMREGWYVDLFDSAMRSKATNVPISDITGVTIMLGASGGTPKPNWKVTFSDYEHCTEAQKLYGFLSNSDSYLLRNPVNKLSNGTFEVQGTGVSNFTNWISYNGTGRISGDTVSQHSGTTSCRLVGGSGSGHETWVRQSLSSVTPGDYHRLTFYSRGDGSSPGRYMVYDNTNSTNVMSRLSTGVSGKAFAGVTYHFQVPMGCVSVGMYFYCPNKSGASSLFDDIVLDSVDVANLIVA